VQARRVGFAESESGLGPAREVKEGEKEVVRDHMRVACKKAFRPRLGLSDVGSVRFGYGQTWPEREREKEEEMKLD